MNKIITQITDIENFSFLYLVFASTRELIFYRVFLIRRDAHPSSLRWQSPMAVWRGRLPHHDNDKAQRKGSPDLKNRCYPIVPTLVFFQFQNSDLVTCLYATQTICLRPNRFHFAYNPFFLFFFFAPSFSMIYNITDNYLNLFIIRSNEMDSKQ